MLNIAIALTLLILSVVGQRFHLRFLLTETVSGMDQGPMLATMLVVGYLLPAAVLYLVLRVLSRWRAIEGSRRSMVWLAVCNTILIAYTAIRTVEPSDSGAAASFAKAYGSIFYLTAWIGAAIIVISIAWRAVSGGVPTEAQRQA